MRELSALGLLLLCAGCEKKQEGTATDYHLQEHTVQVSDALEASVIADCRGNNHLSWEVLDSEAFEQPARVGVFCGMYLNAPPAGQFTGWGTIKPNWAQSEHCSHENATEFGGENCSDYFRALRDDAPVGAPWCQISFSYNAPVTTKLRIVTYCK